MINRTTKTAGIAAAALLSLGGGAYAATNALSSPTPLTGSVTDQVSAAALKAVPGGTLVGVESEPGGTYDAQVLKSDGTTTVVELDEDFAVTGTHAGGGGRGFGDHGRFGHGGFDTAALAKSLGVDESKLQTALQAVRDSNQSARQATQAAAIAKSLGVSASDVQTVLAAQTPTAGRRGHDDGALATALASKFNVTQAKAQAALDSARPDRNGARPDDQLASALAKQLGLDTAKVQAALDAQRSAARP